MNAERPSATAQTTRTRLLARAALVLPYGAALGLCLGIYLFVSEVSVFEPLKTWHVWRFGYIWLVTLAWAFSLVSAGHAALRTLLRRPLPVLEHLCLAFSLGLLLFQLAVFLCGLAGFLKLPFFFGLPLLFAASGARPIFRYARRLLRLVRGKPRKLRASSLLLGAFGVLGLVAMYVPIITPSHIGFDSGMYHVPVAEHYLAGGAIRRFADGWIPGTYPQMASLVYTWGLCTPGLEFLDRLVLLAHFEFAIFVATLVGVSALVRALLGPGRGRLAWVACFTFPCLLLHDLQMAADHFAALWFVPMYLCLFRAWPKLDFRFTGLTAACAAGALLTKYTAYPMVLFPAIAILGRGLFLLVRPVETRAAVLRGLGTALLVGLLFTASHWLKNFVWYGDPLYPSLNHYLHLRPWNADAAVVTDVYLNQIGLSRPPHTWEGVKETLHSLYFFSFKAFEFYEYHRDVPYFGSLFTVVTFAAPFLKLPRRAWAVLLGIYVSLFAWYWLSHYDRYLQAFLPGMAAIVAVVFELCWRRGWLFRVPVVLATTLQLVWGADVLGIPVQVERYKRSLSTIGATYNGQDSLRTADLGAWMQIGAELPPRAVLLIHDALWHLGVQRRTVNDWVGLQGGVDYGRLASARDTYQLLHGLRVTHLAWAYTAMNDDSLAGDLRFRDFVGRFAVGQHYAGGINVATMPAAMPAAERPDWVLVATCSEAYAAGLYRFEQTNVPAIRGMRLWPYPAPEVALSDDNVSELVGRATFAITHSGDSCQKPAAKRVRENMKEIGTRGTATLWTRATH